MIVQEELKQQLNELVQQIRDNAKKKFDETVEMAINTNIDGKKTEQSIKGAMILPHKINIQRVVVAITDEENVDADIVGLHDVIEKIKNNEIPHIDRCITTIDKMNFLKPISALLGKKGIMPNKKFNSLGNDIHELAKNARQDIHYQSERNGGIVHLSVGKLSMSNDEISDNIAFALYTLHRSFNDVSQTKIQNKITSVYLSTTQGIGSVPIDNYREYI